MFSCFKLNPVIFMIMISLALIVSLFLLMNQPFQLVILLILLVLPAIFLAIAASESAWIGYITFLIYLGGLLIIFVYMSALIPNQLSLLIDWGSELTLTLCLLFLNQDCLDLKMMNTVSSVELFSMINYSNYIFLMIIYLLMMLFSIAGLTNFIKSPLKSY
uniref:NADH dehydogenase subunit 6 n=1 Tax=Batillipes longispinosus TaxID=1477119 RepID=A0A0K0KA14_9BILA|nr:NADH dehydogenase subunit 6 [Batillipes longispinosus]